MGASIWFFHFKKQIDPESRSSQQSKYNGKSPLDNNAEGWFTKAEIKAFSKCAVDTNLCFGVSKLPAIQQQRLAEGHPVLPSEARGSDVISTENLKRQIDVLAEIKREIVRNPVPYHIEFSGPNWLRDRFGNELPRQTVQGFLEQQTDMFVQTVEIAGSGTQIAQTTTALLNKLSSHMQAVAETTISSGKKTHRVTPLSLAHDGLCAVWFKLTLRRSDDQSAPDLVAMIPVGLLELNEGSTAKKPKQPTSTVAPGGPSVALSSGPFAITPFIAKPVASPANAFTPGHELRFIFNTQPLTKTQKAVVKTIMKTSDEKNHLGREMEILRLKVNSIASFGRVPSCVLLSRILWMNTAMAAGDKKRKKKELSPHWGPFRPTMPQLLRPLEQALASAEGIPRLPITVPDDFANASLTDADMAAQKKIAGQIIGEGEMAVFTSLGNVSFLHSTNDAIEWSVRHALPRKLLDAAQGMDHHRRQQRANFSGGSVPQLVSLGFPSWADLKQIFDETRYRKLWKILDQVYVAFSLSEQKNLLQNLTRTITTFERSPDVDDPQAGETLSELKKAAVSVAEKLNHYSEGDVALNRLSGAVGLVPSRAEIDATLARNPTTDAGFRDIRKDLLALEYTRQFLSEPELVEDALGETNRLLTKISTALGENPNPPSSGPRRLLRNMKRSFHKAGMGAEKDWLLTNLVPAQAELADVLSNHHMAADASADLSIKHATLEKCNEKFESHYVRISKDDTFIDLSKAEPREDPGLLKWVAATAQAAVSTPDFVSNSALIVGTAPAGLRAAWQSTSGSSSGNNSRSAAQKIAALANMAASSPVDVSMGALGLIASILNTAGSKRAKTEITKALGEIFGDTKIVAEITGLKFGNSTKKEEVTQYIHGQIKQMEKRQDDAMRRHGIMRTPAAALTLSLIIASMVTGGVALAVAGLAVASARAAESGYRLYKDWDNDVAGKIKAEAQAMAMMAQIGNPHAIEFGRYLGFVKFAHPAHNKATFTADEERQIIKMGMKYSDWVDAYTAAYIKKGKG